CRHRTCRTRDLAEKRPIAGARRPAGHLRGHDRRRRRARSGRALRQTADDPGLLHGHEGRVAAGGALLLRRPAGAGDRSAVSARRRRRGAAAPGGIGTVRQDRPRRAMNLQRLGVSLFTLIAVVSILLAAATIWLFVTNPVTVATAVNDGDVSPL